MVTLWGLERSLFRSGALVFAGELACLRLLIIIDRAFFISILICRTNGSSDVHFWHAGCIGPMIVEDKHILGHESAGEVSSPPPRSP